MTEDMTLQNETDLHNDVVRELPEIDMSKVKKIVPQSYDCEEDEEGELITVASVMAKAEQSSENAGLEYVEDDFDYETDENDEYDYEVDVNSGFDIED